MKSEYHLKCLEISKIIKDYAEQYNLSASELSTKWILKNKLIKGVIAGPGNKNQLFGYIKALNVLYSDENEKFIENLNQSGQQIPSTYVSHHLPVIGRTIE